MRRYILLLLFLSVAGSAPADELRPVSTITDVVIYPDTGRVTREAQVDLKEGTHTVYFAGIKPFIDENFITVAGQGAARVKIYGAKVMAKYLTENADTRVKELEQKLEALSDQTVAEQAKLTVLESKRQFLESVKLFAAGQLPKDLVTTMPSPENLDKTLAFLNVNLTALETDKQQVNVTLRGLAKQIAAVSQELNKVRGVANRSEQTVAVDLECGRTGNFTLRLAYMVGNVYWSPVYDARVEADSGKTLLAFGALIRQNSGEDWDDVKLTVSTAKPSIGGSMPQLDPWWLRPRVARAERMFKTGRWKDAYQDTDRMVASNAVQYESLAALASPHEEKAQTAQAQPEARGTAVVYTIAKPVTIKADGNESRVPVTEQDLPSIFEYSTTPKLSPYAYLKAVAQNGEQDRLLAGPVNVFLNGDFVSRSQMEKTVAEGEKFNLYLGADEGVAVKRDLLEEKTDDTFLGNIPSANQTTFFAYKITVENHKKKEIKINVYDQIPVAQDDKIHVKDVKYSVKPSAENYLDRKGVNQWQMTLKPGEKQVIAYSFIVEHPRQLVVEGL
ncbi:MAG: mucoidy inhibitor MuiA family protein [Candidatus Omnitrophica bacterium]|nr:mucoidy inhibitor MuiA family protein [Candidatus Omnitrophota bacterium]